MQPPEWLLAKVIWQPTLQYHSAADKKGIKFSTAPRFAWEITRYCALVLGWKEGVLASCLDKLFSPISSLFVVVFTGKFLRLVLLCSSSLAEWGLDILQQALQKYLDLWISFRKVLYMKFVVSNAAFSRA